MLFVLFLSLPSSTSIFGQIVIKERIKIEPKVEINLNDISSSDENTHTIKLIRDWDPQGSWCKQKFRIQYCNETVYSNADNSGHLEFDFTVLQGTCHTVTLLLNCYDGYGWGNFGGPFNIYVDDILFKEDVHISALVQPWYGRLGIRVFNDDLFFGSSESITYYTQKACAPIIGTFGVDYPMISIVKGNKYLSFYTSDTDEIIGDNFDMQEYIGNSIPRLKYDIPYYGTERLEAVIEAEVNGVSVYDTVIVNPIADCTIEVTCNPDLLLISEESTISLKQILEDESTIDFPDEQLFDVEIIEGAEYGTIVSSNETADTFLQIEQGFSFVADSTIYNDVEVLIKVSTEIGGQSISSRKGKDIIAPAGGGFGETIYGIGNIKIKNFTILLGETKYFGVQKKDEKYKIVEIPTTYGSEPKWSTVTLTDGWQWKKESSVWGTEPIEKLGSKSGVYWEKKYPIYKGNSFSRMKNLDNGIIRIIGRYWEEGKENDFKVKLETTDKAEIVVKVVKPTTIGLLKDRELDVKGEEYNLDDLIIKYAGKNGITPQIIKGIIEKESSFKNAMRWEPFFEINPKLSKIHRKNKDNIYTHWTQTKSRYTIKSETDIGYPVIPATHSNINGVVYPNNYWGYQGSVWKLFYKNCKQFNPYAESDIYNKKAKSWDYNLEKGWKQQKKDAIKSYKKTLGTAFENEWITIEQYSNLISSAENYGEDFASEWAEKEYNQGIMGEIAQTRIATSYGLMQVLYTTATWLRGYSKDFYSNTTPQTAIHLPEHLNEKDISLKYGAESIAYYLDKEIDNKKNENDENWDLGFERTFEISLFAYNHGWKKERYNKKDYGYFVLEYAKKYLPAE